MGLENEVVGITKFCVHPKNWFLEKPKIGGTKTLNFNKIEALKPDLIIGNKEENERSQIEELEKQYPVWLSDVKNLDGALDMILKIGQLTGKISEANSLSDAISFEFSQLKAPGKPQKAAYLIWRKPFMVAGGDTYINSMLKLAGFENAFAHLDRYPELLPEKLAEAKPEAIFLSSEPYPFKEKHISELREICPAAKIHLVDGEMFSWYGSRLLKSAAYFRNFAQNFF